MLLSSWVSRVWVYSWLELRAQLSILNSASDNWSLSIAFGNNGGHWRTKHRNVVDRLCIWVCCFRRTNWKGLIPVSNVLCIAVLWRVERVAWGGKLNSPQIESNDLTKCNNTLFECNISRHNLGLLHSRNCKSQQINIIVSKKRKN